MDVYSNPYYSGGYRHTITNDDAMKEVSIEKTDIYTLAIGWMILKGAPDDLIEFNLRYVHDNYTIDIAGATILKIPHKFGSY